MNHFRLVRIVAFISITTILSLLLLLACRPQGDVADESRDVSVPIGVAFKTAIGGSVLGQRLEEPFGVASDMRENLYLVDAGNDRILKFDADFQPVREVGGFGSEDGQFSAPSYIYMSNSLNLYVSDAGNYRVSVFDSKLNFARHIYLDDSDDPSKYGQITGLWVNDYGDLWAADSDKSVIWIFNSIGQYDRTLGGIESTGGFLLNPAGMADGNKRVYVCDKGNHMIKVYDEFGVFDFEFGDADLKGPSGVTVDDEGNIWVADADLPGVLCFDRFGEVILSEADFFEKTGLELDRPVDITVLKYDRLAVSDFDQNQVLIYQIFYP